MKIEILNLFKQLDSCNKTLSLIVLYITAIFHKNLTESTFIKKFYQGDVLIWLSITSATILGQN